MMPRFMRRSFCAGIIILPLCITSECKVNLSITARYVLLSIWHRIVLLRADEISRGRVET